MLMKSWIMKNGQTALYIAILKDSPYLKAEALCCSMNAAIMNIARLIGSRSCSMENASSARGSGKRYQIIRDHL